MDEERVFYEFKQMSKRIRDVERRSKELDTGVKSQADIGLTDLEIAQIENDQATTDLEIAVAELQTA